MQKPPWRLIKKPIWQSAGSATVGNGDTFIKVGNLLTATAKDPTGHSFLTQISPSTVGLWFLLSFWDDAGFDAKLALTRFFFFGETKSGCPKAI
jgi:hypothetical protein